MSEEAKEPQAVTEDALRDVLRNVIDPDLYINIVDLGLVYGLAIEDRTVFVDMTFTSPGYPYGPYLVHQVQEELKAVDGVEETHVEVVWDPPWGPDKMSEEARLELGFDI